MPVIMLRGDGQMNPDGVRDYDLLVPAAAERPSSAQRVGRGRRSSARPSAPPRRIATGDRAAAPPTPE